MVYNTVQLYLVDGNHRLRQMHNQATKEGFYLGLKLVRGAYMEKERKIAQRNTNLPSPICASKEETDANFNTSGSYCYKHLDKIAVVLGSHNEDSVIQAIKIMDRHEIKLTTIVGFGLVNCSV